jgi:hypothetical protein
MSKERKMGLEVYHYSQLKDFIIFPIKIKNSTDNWCKPIGGLWCSPIGSNFGWEDCDAGEQFLQKGMTKAELKLEGEFIIINTAEDLDKLPWNKLYEDSDIEFIDFEKIVREGVDAIYLTEEGLRQTRLPYRIGYGFKFRNLYGWDCESVLILNERCIKEWKKVDFDINKVKERRMMVLDKLFEELLNKKRGYNGISK